MQLHYVRILSQRIFTVDIKKGQILWYDYDFSIHYDSIDVDEILDIHKYLRKKNEIKHCLDQLNIIKQLFIELLNFGGSLATRCASLNNK